MDGLGFSCGAMRWMRSGGRTAMRACARRQVPVIPGCRRFDGTKDAGHFVSGTGSLLLLRGQGFCDLSNGSPRSVSIALSTGKLSVQFEATRFRWMSRRGLCNWRTVPPAVPAHVDSDYEVRVSFHDGVPQGTVKSPMAPSSVHSAMQGDPCRSSTHTCQCRFGFDIVSLGLTD